MYTIYTGYRSENLRKKCLPLVDEQFTTISNWSNDSTYERRYNFFNTAKTLSNRQ